MKKILILSASLLVVGNAYALPQCPPSDHRGPCFDAYTFPSGAKYVGEWRDIRFHGQGTYTFDTGDKYVGDFKDGKRHGQGTQTSTDGGVYVGEWKDGKFHGQGTFTSSHLHVSFLQLQNCIKRVLRCLHFSPQMTSGRRTHTH